ncbi:MAG: SIS domain-containing protein [Candidatus Bathyarchaeia archaeon]
MNPERFTHHMLREIREEPRVVEATMNQSQKTVERIVDEVQSKNYDLIYITGSGTSYHAGLASQYVLFNFGITMTSLIPASEFPLWIPSTIDRKALLIAISQSGESTDTLKAVNAAMDRGIEILAVTNTEGSTLATKAQYTLITRAGKELAVTATKSYVAQLAILFLFSLESAEKQGTSEDLAHLRRKLFETPRLIEEVIKTSNDTMLNLAEKYKDRNFFFALGSGPNYATALETALKLKEACNIFAEGFASREFLHGPIQLINEKTPVIFILQSDEVENLMSLLRSVRNFRAPVISVSDNEEKLTDVSTEVICTPKNFPKIFSPILYIVPLQLFAYYSSVVRGLNPDKPEKLSKVVK